MVNTVWARKITYVQEEKLCHVSLNVVSNMSHRVSSALFQEFSKFTSIKYHIWIAQNNFFWNV